MIKIHLELIRKRPTIPSLNLLCYFQAIPHLTSEPPKLKKNIDFKFNELIQNKALHFALLKVNSLLLKTDQLWLILKKTIVSVTGM